ncbi:MAG: ABC transporter ATP-binding protein [Myxococcales bacterium]|nr:ABC transporter ATP-binding protein [Myxococcales bacterium]
MSEKPKSSALDIALHVVREGHGQSFQLDVEFTAHTGINILFGPSGSGKSTILQAVAGLYRPGKGHIRLGDEVWSESQSGVFLPPEKRGVAYLFQSLALFPHMTATQNVCYGMSRQLSRAQREERAHDLLGRVGANHLSSRKPKTFSGGEAQRVALARALATSPRVLLLDEPFSALDRDLRVQLAQLVVELVHELGIPALQVTHNHGEAASMGSRVLKMSNGRIVEDGSPGEVLEDHRDFSDIGKTPMLGLLPHTLKVPHTLKE